jgi:hypothetical protein
MGGSGSVAGRFLVLALAGCITAAAAVPLAHGALIGTADSFLPVGASASRARLAALIERPDIAAELTRLGIPVGETRERIAALTDSEAARLVQHIESLPAGGTDVLGALLVVFMVLLVTDGLGFTKVFSFVGSIR